MYTTKYNLRIFSKVYINKPISFSKTRKDYIEYFIKVFNLIDSYRPLLSPKELFVGYPTLI